MNDEELKRALEALPPQDPRIDGWARRARRRSQARRSIAAAAVLLVGLGLPAGYLANLWHDGRTQTPVAPNPLAVPTHIPDSPLSAPDSPPPTPVDGDELTGIVAISSVGATDEAKLCARSILPGDVQDLRQPVCTGPRLKGSFSWDDVPHTTVDGRRWTEEEIQVYGHYDVNDGPMGSFTLSRPVEVTAPTTPQPEQAPQRDALCADPIVTEVGDPEQWQVGSSQFVDAIDVAVASSGYVSWWVDGEVGYLNVEVRKDADVDALSAELGAAWGGPICVGVAAEVGPESEDTVRQFFASSMHEQQLADLRTVGDPDRIEVTLWGSYDDLVDWLQSLELQDLPETEGIVLTVEFVLNPVGTEPSPITIRTR